MLARLGLFSVCGALVLKSCSLLFQILTDRRFFPGVSLTDGFVDLTSGLALVANLAIAISFVATGVLFLGWFYSSYQRLEDIDAAVLPAEWALFGWFVPGLNLIRPVQIMGELTNQFSPGRRPKKARFTQRLGLWWFGGIIGAGVHVLLRFNQPDSRRGWVYWESVALLATLALLVSAIACLGLMDRAVRKQQGIENTPPRLRRRAEESVSA